LPLLANAFLVSILALPAIKIKIPFSNICKLFDTIFSLTRYASIRPAIPIITDFLPDNHIQNFVIIIDLIFY